MNKELPHKLHDHLFRDAMSIPTIAKDFFETYLPYIIKKEININNIKLKPNAFIERNEVNNEYEETITDMLFSTNINKDKAYIYLLTEHFSTAKKLTPFKILKYVLNIISYHQKESKTDELPIVFPILFFNGTNTYNQPLRFVDIYPKKQRELMERIWKEPICLVDLNTVDDEKTKEHLWGRLLTLTMQANTAIYKRHLEALGPILAKTLEKVDNEHDLKIALKILPDMLQYTITTASLKNTKVIDYYKMVTKQLKSNKLKGDIMSAAEQLRQEGKQESLQQTALAMLANKFDVKTIANITGFSIEHINNLKNSKDFNLN